MGNDNTIFDDVFRTMLERMPQLVIPVINEIFHTSYSEDEPIEQYRNEHHTKSGEIITDSYLGICDKLYHLECESRSKSNMSIRMIEYDFAIALENAEQTEDVYEINFPHSCVLYLRHTAQTPDALTVKVNLPDGRHFLYHTPTVKLQEYTKEEIFQNGFSSSCRFISCGTKKIYQRSHGIPNRSPGCLQSMRKFAYS